MLNPAGSGSIVKLISQISRSDELWYDPATHRFFVTGVDATNGRAFDVFSDTSFSLLDSVALPSVNAHSITVDPFNGNVFVPLEGTTAAGTDSLCPLGCVAVFAPVPEPPVAALDADGAARAGRSRLAAPRSALSAADGSSEG